MGNSQTVRALLGVGFGALSTIIASGVAAEPASAGSSRHMTYCAYFLPDGNHKRSYCSPLKLNEAQKECDARLKAQRIEGTCSCTDDQAYINGRC